MMHIRASDATNQLLDNMATGVFVSKHILGKINMIQFGLIAKESVEQALHSELGDKAKHFKVTLIGSNQFGVRISLMADDVGQILVKGAKDHLIYASEKMALHFVWNGEEVFFESVDHPGIKPMEAEITKIVSHAIYKAAALYG